jgi:primosomal protein N' (replication factor Y) (superfamily II helicase)
MIARVRLDITTGQEFDYAIPAELREWIEIGSRVKVPLGGRQVMGCVMALCDVSPYPNPRSILKVVGQQALVTPEVLTLARWISDYYCCPLEIALKSVLPQAVRKEREGWKYQLRVRALAIDPPSLSLTKRQAEIWQWAQARQDMPLQELLETAHATAETLRKMEAKGAVVISSEIAERDPYAREHLLPTRPLPLNSEQAEALKQILGSMDAARERGAARAAQAPEPATTFLLHGVTGSGKTEVYLQAIAHALEQGGGAIVLVPEIALTPQTVERFKARFCSGTLQTQVAVLHSHLSAGERHDEWHKIRQGRARIAIGARSAIFAPVSPLSLIVVDEEHEQSYKQEEAPRYHARDVAVMRGRLEGTTVVLGSATPSLESYHNVRQAKYRLLEMRARADDKKMPVVRVVDMRQETHVQKGTPMFSRKLAEAMRQRLEKNEQTMLFLNRRGYSSSLQCPKCGYVAGCPHCSVSLTYHRHEQKLCCHCCGYETTVPQVCPTDTCRNPEIRYVGLGTEKVEETLAKMFPRARIRRMDSDSMKRKEDYRTILGDFRAGKIDILIGTQMIAKGLHFPNVTLVGIVYADMSLHIPDFRASERTFQLLTQVSGRAGRGEVEGEVIIQAFTPFHPAIQYARHHDFLGFFEQEIEFRRQLQYPPVGRMALLTLRGRSEEKVQFSAEYIKQELERAWRDETGLIIAGPAPAPLLKKESFFRYQIMLRTRRIARLSKRLQGLLAGLKLPDDVTLAVDIDPVNLV